MDRHVHAADRTETRVIYLLGAAVIIALGVVDILRSYPVWSVRMALVPAVVMLMFARSWVVQARHDRRQLQAIWLVRAHMALLTILTVSSIAWSGQAVWAVLGVAIVVSSAVLAFHSWRLRKSMKATN